MTLDKTPKAVQNMFDKIAGKYDFINNIMSFGLHNFVKYKAVKSLDIKPYDKVLDLCCGTGDLSGITKKLYPKVSVIGIDFSDSMLEIARKKYGQIPYIKADATNLPVLENSLDFVIMGFGLRNIQNAEKAIEEVFRILHNGGYFLHLDFGRKNLASKIYDITTKVITKIFSKNVDAYKYLIKSKREFLTPDELIEDFEKKGFKLKKRQDYLFGVISAQIMQKI